MGFFLVFISIGFHSSTSSSSSSYSHRFYTSLGGSSKLLSQSSIQIRIIICQQTRKMICQYTHRITVNKDQKRSYLQIYQMIPFDRQPPSFSFKVKKLLMKVNQSDEYRSRQHSYRFPTSSHTKQSQPSIFAFEGKRKQTTNPHRRTQIIISLVLAALTTLWVQITMQRHAPFVRTAQCYFNEVIFLHDSQDIYQGDDVIYWRNGETISFVEMRGIFQRLSQTIQNLNEVSLFQIPHNYTKLDQDDADVDMMMIYKYSLPEEYETYKTYNFSISEMTQVFNQTLLDRGFYQHLWKINIQVTVPVVYRNGTKLMKLFFSAQIYSSVLMQYKMNVDIVDDDNNEANADNYSESNLGIRGLNHPHDIQLDIPYLKWIIVGLFMVIAVFQYKFILQKNRYINQKIKQKLMEEDQIQELLGKFDQRVKNPVRDSTEELIMQMVEQVEVKNKKGQQKYDLPLNTRLKKIGIYYVLELVVSILAFLGFFNNFNGVVCFFAWTKILIYLAETKNRLMFGFLYQEALPIYLKVELNIVILMTSFVLFNMVVLSVSSKFQTLELGYFEYLFNYFQYGIYENFYKAFGPYGRLVQFFYFLQIMLLLYVGNNILISILASQVSKNSMLVSVEEMVDELMMRCPACGTDFKGRKKGNQQSIEKEMLVSRIMKDLQLEKSRVHSQVSQQQDLDDQNYAIVIKSPTLAPYFPKKNQNKKQQQLFLSPHMKNKTLKDRMKEINKKMQKQQDQSESRIQAYEQLKGKLNTSSKKKQIQLMESNIERDRSDKFTKGIRNKTGLIFKEIQQFKGMLGQDKRVNPALNREVENRVYGEVLNKLLARIKTLKTQINKKFDK